jgi:RimJ/RimL family protein N-acetyltransferase
MPASFIPDDWRDRLREFLGAESADLRVMRPDDIDEVLRIIRLHDTDDYRAARQVFESASFDADEDLSAHFVALDPEERRVVGVSGYYVDDLEAEGIYWLGWTYVNPYFQGQGHGLRLVRAIAHTVAQLGARKLYLSTSSHPSYEEARGFYERFGFMLEGRLYDYYTPGEDKLIYGLYIDEVV